MKAIIATVTIFTNSNYFKFTEGESAKTLWAGNKIDINVKYFISPTQEVFHMMDQQLMLYIAIT